MKAHLRKILVFLIALTMLSGTLVSCTTPDSDSVTGDTTVNFIEENTDISSTDPDTDDSDSPIIPEAPEPKEYYYYVLINSERLTRADRIAISRITGAYSDHDVFIMDVKDAATATDVYELLKADSTTRSGKLDGIQIFGTSDMVPSFVIDYKVPIKSGGEETFSVSPAFFSDYFYSNFKNDVEKLCPFNLADNFASDDRVNFSPEWSVARLALGSGEFEAYVNRYDTYLKENGTATPLAACFSSSIFRYFDTSSVDDFAVFMTRAKNEWKILNDVRIYTNQKGDFVSPVGALGDCGVESFAAENAAGVREFFFTGHGSQRALLRTVWTSDGKSSTEELLTDRNITETLGKNPYFLYLTSCSTAEGLDFNMIRTALNNGCIGAFASTTLASNNGIECEASLEEMRDTGNYFYFHYCYLKGIYEGMSRSDAIFYAQKEMESVLSECAGKTFDYSHNFQLGYNNLLCYANIGVIEPDAEALAEPEQFDDVPKKVYYTGTEHYYVTSGKPVGEVVKLSPNIMRNDGGDIGVLSSATAVKLDNGYIRIRLGLNTKNGGILMLPADNGYYLGNMCEGYCIYSEKYILSIDIPESEFKANNSNFYFALSLDGKMKLWGFTGFGALK